MASETASPTILLLLFSAQSSPVFLSVSLIVMLYGMRLFFSHLMYLVLPEVITFY